MSGRFDSWQQHYTAASVHSLFSNSLGRTQDSNNHTSEVSNPSTTHQPPMQFSIGTTNMKQQSSHEEKDNYLGNVARLHSILSNADSNVTFTPVDTFLTTALSQEILHAASLPTTSSLRDLFCSRSFASNIGSPFDLSGPVDQDRTTVLGKNHFVNKKVSLENVSSCSTSPPAAERAIDDCDGLTRMPLSEDDQQGDFRAPDTKLPLSFYPLTPITPSPRSIASTPPLSPSFFVSLYQTTASNTLPTWKPARKASGRKATAVSRSISSTILTTSPHTTEELSSGELEECTAKEAETQ